jgi:phospholipid/cholesterol/gamma-HCH transport system ATP-binding protein
MSPPPALEPMIDVQNVHKSFAGFPVLTGINLKMMEGTTTVVLGASGSGKTVLMKHIMGLFKPDHGQVIVDGQNVSTMRIWRSFGSGWGWCFRARRCSIR